MILSDTEREIFERSLVTAEKRLAHARGAKEGTAVFESAVNIEAQIEYLRVALEVDGKAGEAERSE